MQFRKIITSQRLSLAVLIFCASLPGFATPIKKSIKASKSLPQTQLMQHYLRSDIVAHSLGWIPTHHTCNACHGYFFQPDDLIRHPNPLPATELPSVITSRGPTEFVQNGTSKLSDGVVVTQPGRRITADTAFIERDAKTGKVTVITLIGNVHFAQYNRLIVATYARMDLLHHTIALQNALYHLGPAYQGERGQKIKLDYDAWGYAAYVHNPSQQLIKFQDATYSTCSPLNQVWTLYGNHMRLNRDSGLGHANNVVIRFRKIPVVYFPYLRFPIDNRRVTGILIPTFSQSRQQGTRFGQPFYWNMAPNYDMTITPYYNLQRGLQVTDLFRYMTALSRGNLDLSYLPYDQDFKNYRIDTINEYNNTPDLQEYVDQLKTMHDYRGYAGFNGSVNWSDDWQAHYHVNYVTDPYYFRDVLSTYSFNNPNQLLNELDVQYQGDHWNLFSFAQGYQTLHRIDEFETPAYNQYMRLPEVDTTGFYPSMWKRFNTHLSAQAVDFQYQSVFPTQTPNVPTPVGQRFHVRPSVDYDAVWSAGYIDPQIYVDTTSYITQFQTTPSYVSRSDFNQTRVMPIADVDAGLYFDRSFHFNEHSYIQTLEPRLFYLYVPYKSQGDYPIFDTQLLPFSYNQLFTINRFAGFDRLDNANQTSFGLTSRILDSDEGGEKIRADLGVIYYLQNPQVQLPGLTLPDPETFSPVIGSLTYSINRYLSYSGNAAWDIQNNQMNNAGTALTYQGGNNRIMTLGYNYVYYPGKDVLGFNQSTNQIYGGVSTPFYNQWTGFGYMGYDFSNQYPTSYLAGLQYDSCCWALRFVFDREFLSRSPSSTPTDVINQYNNIYYVQLQLKGLSSVGKDSATSVLASRFPGYKDPFLNSL